MELSFEKQLHNLENTIKELKLQSTANGIDLSAEIAAFETKLDNMRKGVYQDLTAWNKVELSRHSNRPTARDYIDKIFDDFLEMHGDRNYGDDKSIVTGIATYKGMSVTVIGIQKGRNLQERVDTNFGMPHPEGYRKALRAMKQAEKFKRPVICFVDTPGAFCGIGAEERGQGEAIATNLVEMARLKTPLISIIIGEGGSGGALALAAGDEVWMLEHSIYSILSPEGFASILFKDASRAKEAAQAMKITSGELKEFGIIDKVINEPDGGAHKGFEEVCVNLDANLKESMNRLTQTSLDELLDNRYDKFRQMGEFIG